MQENLLEIGVGGIFAVILIREVLTFVGKWRGNNSPGYATEREVDEIRRVVENRRQNEAKQFDTLNRIETDCSAIKADVTNIKDRVTRIESKVFNGG